MFSAEDGVQSFVGGDEFLLVAGNARTLGFAREDRIVRTKSPAICERGFVFS